MFSIIVAFRLSFFFLVLARLAWLFGIVFFEYIAKRAIHVLFSFFFDLCLIFENASINKKQLLSSFQVIK